MYLRLSEAFAMRTARAMEKIQAIDSHTAGEPTRLVISGGPGLGGGPLRQRLERFRSHNDSFRSTVVNEPRGSNVLVGALLCEPRRDSRQTATDRPYQRSHLVSGHRPRGFRDRNISSYRASCYGLSARPHDGHSHRALSAVALRGMAGPGVRRPRTDAFSCETMTPQERQ
jgi:hypothetical protein